MTPETEECDHEWRYEAPDDECGLSGYWVCIHCGQDDDQRGPPNDDYY